MLVDKKILESERNQVYVKSNEGVRLNGSVEENKNVFDKFPQLIMNKYNELIDLLIASGLDTVSDDFLNRYTKTETDSLIETETSTLVADIGIDLATGVITVTKKDGSKTTIDTALEKVPSTFEFVEDTENDKFYLKVTNVDGTTSQTEVTNLMNQYTFSEGDIVSFVISKSGTTTTVTANIKNGSIGLAQLSTEVKQYYEEIKSSVSADRAAVEADKAVVLDASQTVTSNTTLVLSYKEAAEENALLSKSYAIGNTGARVDEDTDNSLYYSNEAKYARNQAQAAQAAAEEARDQAQAIAGGDFATKAELNAHINNTTLHLTADEKTKWNNKAECLNLISPDLSSATHTPLEIISAMSNGNVILMAMGGVCNLVNYDIQNSPNYVVLQRQFNSIKQIVKITINEDKTFTLEPLELASIKTFSGTLGTSYSSEDSPYYTQNVDITGIYEDDEPIIDLITTEVGFEKEQEEWNKIFKAKAFNGYISFYVSERTTIPLNFNVKVLQ